MTKRTEQVSSLLQKLISEAIASEMEISKEALVTIGRIEVPGDLKTAKVFVSVLPYDKSDQVVKQLNAAKGFIQQTIAKDMAMKFLPKLTFTVDHQAEYASRIDALLDED